MTKKKAPSRVKAAKSVSRIPVKNDISSVEAETIKRVNKTLTNLEDFLAKWDAAKSKPDDMFPQVVKIRQFHDALAGLRNGRAHARGIEVARLGEILPQVCAVTARPEVDDPSDCDPQGVQERQRQKARALIRSVIEQTPDEKEDVHSRIAIPMAAPARKKAGRQQKKGKKGKTVSKGKKRKR